MNLTKIIFSIFALVSFQTFSANWYVNDGSTTGDVFCSAVGNNANNGSSTSTPKRSLKNAYALAASGDVIYIDAGTYSDSLLTIPVAVRNGSITLIGAGTELTIFDGSSGTKKFLSQSGYTENLTLQDFTISGYTGSAGNAAAFTLISSCTANLTNVVITNCSGFRAVSVSGTNSTTSLSINGGGFFCNSAGAMRLNHYSGCAASLNLNKVAFINNSGVNYGAAISIGEESGLADGTPVFDKLTNITIDSCTFESNSGTNTSAVYILNSCSSGCSDYNITYCNFISNTVTTGSSSYGGALVLRVDNATWGVKHCKFDSNTSGNSNGTLTVHSGIVNVDSCYFNNNTAAAGEGQDFYSYYALTSQEAAPYYLNDPTITFTNCSFNSLDDQVSRASGTATVNLVTSGTPTNSGDYSGDGLANTYTWEDLALDAWIGDCGSGYFLSAGDLYWVGGDGNWSDFSNHWSTSSGGGADQTAYPTSTANVFFDSNSDVGNSEFTVNMDVNGECKNFNYNSEYATLSTSTAKTLSATNLNITGGNLRIDNVNTTVSATSAINATLTINTATYNADGTFDATGGTIDFTDAGNLILSSTVTSLGTLDSAMGTVTYDGATQTVLSDSYNNLTISTAGTKTAEGNIDVNGDLTTAATATCALDIATYELNVAGDLTVGAIDGLDLSDASSLLTLDGSADQNIDHAGNSATQIGYELVNYTFESSIEGWNSGGATGSFSRTDVLGAFETGNTGFALLFTQPYVDNSEGDITSPTIDMTNMTSMNLSLKLRYDTEASWDGVTIKYSTGGAYSTLGTTADPGWFNDTDVDGLADTQDGWSGDNLSWTTYNITLPIGLEGQSTVTFKVEFGSDGSGTDNGCAFDDFVITGTYSGGTGSQAKDVSINKSGGDVILSSEFSVDGTLTLTSGDINANTNNLVFTSNGTVSGASDASHVKGTILKTTEIEGASFSFPIGDGTKYRPISISETSSSSSTDWTVSYSPTGHPDTDVDGSGLDHISGQEYWNLDRSIATNAKVSLTWGADNGITDYTELTIAHYDGETDWDMITSTPSGNNTSGTITSDAAVTTFSPFTIGSTGTANPLPVELVTFYGSKHNEVNKLKWTTASEKNSDYFTIEKTIDGVNFESIGQIIGAGNSVYFNSYTLADQNVDNILNYYRLVQVDFDGVKTYSNLISIDNRVDSNKEKILIRKINTLGQEISENYTGIVISIYSDGSIERVLEN